MKRKCSHYKHYGLAGLLALWLVPAGVNAESGLPIPRFISLKSEEVNMRVGPGTRYPIKWVYRKQGLPIEVVDEHNDWRKIRDADGEEGWVHKGLTSGIRTAKITTQEAILLRSTPNVQSPAVIKAASGVTVRLLTCQYDWCRVMLVGRKAWLEKRHLWGVYEDEVFE